MLPEFQIKYGQMHSLLIKVLKVTDFKTFEITNSTKDSILEAITDLIHDAGGNDGFDFSFEDEDHYGSFEQTDFSSLADMDY